MKKFLFFFSFFFPFSFFFFVCQESRTSGSEGFCYEDLVVFEDKLMTAEVGKTHETLTVSR